MLDIQLKLLLNLKKGINMKTSLLKRTVKQILKTNVEKDLNLVPCIWGKTGIGKTEVVKQVLSDLGYKMSYVTIGNMEDVGDLTGAPFVVDGEMRYAKPDWFPTKEKTIVFLDEINRAKPQILQALFPLLNQKRILNIHLPKDCHIIAAANPSTDEYQTNDITDQAFLSRFVHLEFLPTVTEWGKYTSDSKGALDFVSFVQENPNFIQTKVKDFNLSNLVTPDRRKCTDFARFIDDKTPKDV